MENLFNVWILHGLSHAVQVQSGQGIHNSMHALTAELQKAEFIEICIEAGAFCIQSKIGRGFNPVHGTVQSFLGIYVDVVRHGIPDSKPGSHWPAILDSG